ncbi:MAG: putative endonuclease [Parcubacteria group bacterium Athens0714_16]|nr:MAG: putative endonuclease [Parcubacteria group bacterium Athens0714_16]
MHPVRDHIVMNYVYILRSEKSGKFYTGSTNDLRKRLKQHNENKSSYTKNKGPWKIIYYETCINEQDARSREKYLKTGTGKRYLKNRLRHFLPARQSQSENIC